MQKAVLAEFAGELLSDIKQKAAEHAAENHFSDAAEAENPHADGGGDEDHRGEQQRPGEKHLRTYKAIRAGLAEALKKLRAGVTGSTLYHAMMNGVHKSGLPNFHQTFVGHTIGLEPREFPFTLGPTERVSDPFLPETTDVPLPEGAVVNLEVPAGEFGWGGMQVEVSVVVKRSGFDYLIPWRRRLELRR